MALTNCAECKGQISKTATQCPLCGHSTGSAWGACPECGAGITAEQDFCKGCGFPLRPKRKTAAPPPPPPPPPPPAPAPSKGTGRRGNRRKAGPLLEPGQEPPAALIFAILGLFVPILAIVGLIKSKRGSTAYILSWVDIGLWIAGVLFIFSRFHA